MAIGDRLICAVAGHEPYRSRAQRYGETYRAPCKRCGCNLERVRKGVWRAR